MELLQLRSVQEMLVSMAAVLGLVAVIHAYSEDMRLGEPLPGFMQTFFFYLGRSVAYWITLNVVITFVYFLVSVVLKAWADFAN